MQLYLCLRRVSMYDKHSSFASSLQCCNKQNCQRKHDTTFYKFVVYETTSCYVNNSIVPAAWVHTVQGFYVAVHGLKSTHCNSLKHCALQKALWEKKPNWPTRKNKAQCSQRSCDFLKSKQNQRYAGTAMLVSTFSTDPKSDIKRNMNNKFCLNSSVNSNRVVLFALNGPSCWNFFYFLFKDFSFLVHCYCLFHNFPCALLFHHQRESQHH